MDSDLFNNGDEYILIFYLLGCFVYELQSREKSKNGLGELFTGWYLMTNLDWEFPNLI